MTITSMKQQIMHKRGSCDIIFESKKMGYARWPSKSTVVDEKQQWSSSRWWRDKFTQELFSFATSYVKVKGEVRN